MDVDHRNIVNQELAEDYKTVHYDWSSGVRGTPKKTDKDRPKSGRQCARTSMIRPTVEKVASRQRKEAVWVTYCSEQYRRFISSLGKGENSDMPVCLTCW